VAFCYVNREYFLWGVCRVVTGCLNAGSERALSKCLAVCDLTSFTCGDYQISQLEIISNLELIMSTP
jgi:hypothetical protein